MELIHECLANMHLRRFDWGEIDGKVFVSLNVIDLIQPEDPGAELALIELLFVLVKFKVSSMACLFHVECIFNRLFID